MDPIKKLTEHFEHFPGIGPRQAKRFVYHLLKAPASTLRDISDALGALKRYMKTCDKCFRFFETKQSSTTSCSICIDQSRDPRVIMVVAKDIDLENIERSGVFRGTYFVLGNTVPILEKYPERKIRIRELINRLNIEIKNNLNEIIFALNSTPEGDHTTDYLSESLKTLVEKNKIKATILGRGLSTGLELEYSDGDTIKHAVKNRSQLQ